MGKKRGRHWEKNYPPQISGQDGGKQRGLQFGARSCKDAGVEGGRKAGIR